MFKKLTLLLFIGFILLVATPASGLFFKTWKHPRYEQLQTGDIVFQDTGGQQGDAVRAATGSDFTHCGVVFNSKGTLYVLEAIQPVSVISLKEWKKRSTVFHARRLKNPEKLDQAAFTKALAWGEKQLGKPYDFHFKWGDNSLYCSELVWKIYKESTGISLCKPKSFESYFLEDAVVREVIRQRYGHLDKLPKKEPVVAPSDLAASPLLVEVPRR
ncbi:YiiX/YebB-like N1pC/P60 family cysteine hydrolase [Akkermansiaceae bacterium]|nr:YiiX/YebB-like N1pC/P60 family cysteine hydrolase [Akkermansiaceae bacterium]